MRNEARIELKHGPLNRILVKGIGALMLASMLSMLGAHALASDASAQTQEIDLGATVYLAPGTTIGQAVDDFEQLSQRDIDVVRVFLLWDSPWPGAQLEAFKADGKKIYLSVRANNLNGSQVSWAQIASAQPGSALHNQTLAWATRVRDFGDDMYFAFHHEPENRDSLGNGTAVDFIAAWQKVVSVFRANGATNAEFAWTMTEYAFEVTSWDRRQAIKWYPGDLYVDHLAADAYNWADCRPEIDNPWRSLERQIRDFVEFGKTKPSKGMMLAEMATFEHPTNAFWKANWINDARELFKQPEYDQFHTLAWYNHPQAGYPNCDWQVDTSANTLAAWRAFAADPFYGGGSGNPGGGSPVAPVSCSANGVGTASSTVSWVRAANDNATAFVVERRRGTGSWFWLARPSAAATSMVDNNRVAGETYVYRVRTQANGVNSGVTVCTNTGTPPTGPVAPLSCTVSVNGNSATIWWVRADPDNGANFIVERRRNGGTWFWLGRVAVPSNSIVDGNRQAGSTYEYRVRTQSASFASSTNTNCA